METIYELPYKLLAKLTLRDPIFVALVVVSFTIDFAMLAVLAEFMPFWQAAAITIAIAASIIPAMILTLPRGVRYGVEDGYIVVKLYKTYRIPIGEAEVSLTSFDAVKPVMRIIGVQSSTFTFGKYRLENGEKAMVIVYGRPDKAIVVRHGEKLFVISHPGVEEAYERLIKLIKKHGGGR